MANLAVRCVFKYSAFAVGEIANPVLGLTGAAPLSLPQLALPMGISFIVFEKITYQIDVRRGVSAPTQSFPRYLFFVFFSPKLLAGPIVKYHNLQPQLAARHPMTSELVAIETADVVIVEENAGIMPTNNIAAYHTYFSTGQPPADRAGSVGE